LLKLVAAVVVVVTCSSSSAGTSLIAEIPPAEDPLVEDARAPIADSAFALASFNVAA